MLNTKFVKYLQSRPYHTRVSIFVFTMVIFGIMAFSFWTYSLSKTFLAEKNKESEFMAQETLLNQGEKLPSLMNNMKANISEFGDTVSQFYFDYVKSEEKQKTNLDINQIKKIKPVKLPVEKQ
ncbi:hypothetical protein A2907_02805 [Candidatus Azambacteria bacterium RIFCSPLOWO2_01_FULL_37_9]|uniref:Uncharacterized protein n=1 Tax=Candidatus Azambacteria bacterium RIFCSPLOWO2_01_FULL_37_9 TaxID=1797297 RepID=A0A1F5C6K1_9BACT|nr:MAG: hypothetical protein A2907_02805 [Candidatus Azambacteria bacterium RIFCSPLOWO2_01_FULL_37_9]